VKVKPPMTCGGRCGRAAAMAIVFAARRRGT